MNEFVFNEELLAGGFDETCFDDNTATDIKRPELNGSFFELAKFILGFDKEGYERTN